MRLRLQLRLRSSLVFATRAGLRGILRDCFLTLSKVFVKRSFKLQSLLFLLFHLLHVFLYLLNLPAQFLYFLFALVLPGSIELSYFPLESFLLLGSFFLFLNVAVQVVEINLECISQ